MTLVSCGIPTPNHTHAVMGIVRRCYGAETDPSFPLDDSSPPLAHFFCRPVSALSAEQARVLAHLDSVLVVPEGMEAANGECRFEGCGRLNAGGPLGVCSEVEPGETQSTLNSSTRPYHALSFRMKGQFEDAEDQPEDGEAGGDRANGHGGDVNGHAPSS